MAILAHVWERRDEQTWLDFPFGTAQQAKDREFVDAGMSMLDQLLANLPGNAANGFHGWLSRADTTLHVIAPAANPDYSTEDFSNNGNSDGNPNANSNANIWTNPWYTSFVTKGLIYQNAAEMLLKSARTKIGCIDDGEILTYRRRWSNDPDHRTDDRDKIALAPYIFEKRTYVNLMWDDNKLKPITRLN